MSTISTALTDALSSLSTALGTTLEYRTGSTGAWTTLTGFLVDWEDVQAFAHDPEAKAEAQDRMGMLVGPTSPALAVGYNIRVDSGSTFYAVLTSEVDQVQRCLIKQTRIVKAGPDRGGAP